MIQPITEAIWIVDDDADDRELIQDLFKELELPHPLEFFSSAASFLLRLKEVSEAPFMIMCDVNLPGMNGFELRDKMLKIPNSKFHSVPFIFWSTAASEAQIGHAFRLHSHGFFIKQAAYLEWQQTLLQIIRYWQKSCKPSKKDQPTHPRFEMLAERLSSSGLWSTTNLKYRKIVLRSSRAKCSAENAGTGKYMPVQKRLCHSNYDSINGRIIYIRGRLPST